MSVLQRLAVSALRTIDAEKAHAAAIGAIKRGLAPDVQELPQTPPYTFLGQPLNFLTGIPAGFDKRCEVPHLVGRKMGAGLIEVGSFVLKRPGNPKPRMGRHTDGQSVFNWIGLPGDEPEAFVANLKGYRDANPRGQGTLVGVSVAAPEMKPDQAAETLGGLTAMAAPYADYIALNISCPNTEQNTDAALAEVEGFVRAVVAKANGLPVIVKLAPTLDANMLTQTVDRCLQAGATGFEPCNTVPYALRHLIDEKHRPTEAEWLKDPRDGKTPVGGYSGPGLLPISIFMTKTIRRHAPADTPIIAVGGVQSVDDAVKLRAAGADVVCAYTALTREPDLLVRINEAFRGMDERQAGTGKEQSL